MPSGASVTFNHAIQDAVDLINHFDRLNSQPPPPENEVLKRASLVMALAVESHEVVHTRNACDGRLMAERGVWPAPVVAVNEGLQGSRALG